MKTLLMFIAMLLTGSAIAQKASLTVVLKEVKNGTGKVAVAVYDSEKNFMKTRLVSKSVAAAQGEVQVVFEDLPAGNYAISVMHDENENGELDSNFVGMPKEGFGFSNDAKAMFGPPTFDKTVFVHSAAQTIAITLKYL